MGRVARSPSAMLRHSCARHQIASASGSGTSGPESSRFIQSENAVSFMASLESVPLQYRFHSTTRAKEQHLHAFLLQAEDLGDLPMVRALHVGQPEQRPLLLAGLREQPFHVRRKLDFG